MELGTKEPLVDLFPPPYVDEINLVLGQRPLEAELEKGGDEKGNSCKKKIVTTNLIGHGTKSKILWPKNDQ